MRNVFVAIALIVLLLGLGGGIYLSQKNYVPLLSELRSEIERKNSEIEALKKQEEAQKTPKVFMVLSGKVYPSGSDSAILSEIVLSNGEKLRSNGVIIRNNGTTLRLMDGDLVTIDGIIMLSTGSAR